MKHKVYKTLLVAVCATVTLGGQAYAQTPAEPDIAPSPLEPAKPTTPVPPQCLLQS